MDLTQKTPKKHYWRVFGKFSQFHPKPPKNAKTAENNKSMNKRENINSTNIQQLYTPNPYSINHEAMNHENPYKRLKPQSEKQATMLETKV